MVSPRQVTQFVTAVLVLALAPRFAAAQQRGTAGRTAGETGRNIQVLKDLPADQLNPTMRFFAYSLGVECAFCHVNGDQSKDDKPTKVIARSMIRMVMDINKNNFGGKTEVTCFTCHRGTEDPTVAPVIESTKIIPGSAPPPLAERAAGRGAAAEADQPQLPAADAILAKYIQALGGEQALRKITSRTMAGTFDNAGRNTQDVPWTQGTFDLYEKAPNLRLLVMRSASGQTTSAGFDGSASWTQAANGAVTEDAGMALSRARRLADFYMPLNLKQNYTSMKVRGIEKVDGRDAYLVEGDVNGDPPDRLYFDTQSGLLLRRIIANQNVVAAPALQTDYLDYRDANGVKYPATIKISDVIATPMYLVLHVNKADMTTPLDPAKFTKPASAPQPSGGRGGRGGAGRAQ